MRRFISVLTAVLLAFLSAGCMGDTTGGGDSRVGVVATIFAPYDFAREIAGDMAGVTMLLPPASDIHAYEPSPRDIMKIRDCGVFIYVGGESDAWVDKLLSSMDTGNIKIVALMDCVRAVSEELAEGMEADGGNEGAETAAYDEHVWTSPQNAKLIVERISDALCEADEANAPAYRQNAAAYLEKLDGLDAAFKSVTDSAARKTVVFGDRFPFRYLADAYGLEYFAAFPGCSSETEPAASTIAFLINKVREEGIPVIFHAELSGTKTAETVAEATGAKVLLLHACHNISRDDFQNGVSYLELMTRNVEALRKALA